MQEISKLFNSPVVPEVIFFSGAIFLTRLVTRFTLPQAVTNAMILRDSYEITRNKAIHPIVHSMLSVGLSVAILSAAHFSMAICFPRAAPWTGSMISQYRGAAALKFFPLMVLFQSIYALTLDKIAFFQSIYALTLNKKAGVDEFNTDLIKASRMGYIHIVEESLNQGANVNTTDKYKKTPLMYACLFGRLEIVKLLLNKGAEVNATDEYKKTALISACETGRLEIVKLLLNKGADIDAVDQWGMTPLSSANSQRHTEIATLLSDTIKQRLISQIPE